MRGIVLKSIGINCRFYYYHLISKAQFYPNYDKTSHTRKVIFTDLIREG